MAQIRSTSWLHKMFKLFCLLFLLILFWFSGLVISYRKCVEWSTEDAVINYRTECISLKPLISPKCRLTSLEFYGVPSEALILTILIAAVVVLIAYRYVVSSKLGLVLLCSLLITSAVFGYATYLVTGIWEYPWEHRCNGG